MIINTAIFLVFILILYLIIEIFLHLIIPQKDVEIDLGSSKIVGRSGESVLNTLLENEIAMPASCGGKGTCGLCRCKIKSSLVVATEESVLSKKEQQEGVRLACQHFLRDNLEVQLSNEILNAVSTEVQILAINKLNSTLYEFSFSRPDNFDFVAGSYFLIKVPSFKVVLFGKLVKNDDTIMRAYSVSSSQCAKELKITVALVYDNVLQRAVGPGSSWLFSREIGEKLQIVGPYGDFKLQNTNREKCFIAGGAGLSPVASILKSNPLLEATLWFGTRTENYEAYCKLIEDVAKINKKFSYKIAVSDGLSGKMLDDYFLENFVKNPRDISEVEFYLCGPSKMVFSVEEMLLKVGAQRRYIYYDNFG